MRARGRGWKGGGIGWWECGEGREGKGNGREKEVGMEKGSVVNGGWERNSKSTGIEKKVHAYAQ